MVQDIRRDTIRCILFGRDRGIGEGSRVIRTKKRAGIPVGEAFLGRVVKALGEPMDGQGAIEAADFYGGTGGTLHCRQKPGDPTHGDRYFIH